MIYIIDNSNIDQELFNIDNELVDICSARQKLNIYALINNIYQVVNGPIYVEISDHKMRIKFVLTQAEMLQNKIKEFSESSADEIQAMKNYASKDVDIRKISIIDIVKRLRVLNASYEYSFSDCIVNVDFDKN